MGDRELRVPDQRRVSVPEPVGLGQCVGTLWRFWTKLFERKVLDLRSTPTMPAGKDSVVAGSINFVSTSSYTTQIDQAIAAWANQGPIKIKPNDPLNPSYISLEISDTNRPDLKWAGLHHWDPLGVDTLQMNTGTIVSAANARNVMAHEMGHALGFEHNCQSQLMDPRSNSSVFLPQNMDSEAYHSRWGY